MGLDIVAGLSMNNLEPRVWDPNSPYYLPGLKAVMVSFADFANAPKLKRSIIENGFHSSLNLPERVKLYLDNGSFYFLRQGKGLVPREDYEAFINASRPDWYAIPQDFIPSPKMTDEEQLDCIYRTMQVNLEFTHDGYVPVIHICRHLDEYLMQFQSDPKLVGKPVIGLGGIVPNLLRAPKAMSYQDVLGMVLKVRKQLKGRVLHVFGIGGTATLHIAALLNVNSVDSSGWRNRAAHGIVQLPGRGDRTVANLGNWRAREPSILEWDELSSCLCPACQLFGLDGLKAGKLAGFANRATHNLWTLLDEERQITAHLNDNSYSTWFRNHIENSIYKPLIEFLVQSDKYVS